MRGHFDSPRTIGSGTSLAGSGTQRRVEGAAQDPSGSLLHTSTCVLEPSWPEGSDFVEPVRTLLHLSRAAERIQIGQVALPDPSLFAHLPPLTPPPGWTPLRSRTPDVHIFQHPSGLLLHVGDLDQVYQGEVLMRGRRIGLSHLLYWPAPDDLLPLVEHFVGRRPFFAEQEHLPPPPSKAPRNLSMHVRHGGKDFTDLIPGSGQTPWERSAC